MMTTLNDTARPGEASITAIRPGSRARAAALAARLEAGAAALAQLASRLSAAEWEMVMPGDGRRIGVIVHHVASVYPIEIELAMRLADGQAIAGVSWNDVHAMNAEHARVNQGVTVAAALDLLARNSATAAAAIRTLSDGQLDRAGCVSLNSDAPLTCQFFLEDHAVRHSYHHAARIRAAVAAQTTGGAR